MKDVDAPHVVVEPVDPDFSACNGRNDMGCYEPPYHFFKGEKNGPKSSKKNSFTNEGRNATR